MLYNNLKLQQTMLYATLLAIFLSGSVWMVHCEEGELVSRETANYCDNDCGENGECRGSGLYVPGCVPENDPQKCEIYKCACQYGWDGDACTIQFETCEDHITTSPDENARQCFNGGKCESYVITDPPEMRGEKGIRCNCQSLPTDAVAYAGHQCEFPSEQVCVRGAEHSTYAFCVNGGTCKDFVEFNEEHPLCNCMPGSGGRYCQYNLTTDGSTFESTPVDEIAYVNIIMNGKYGNETTVLEPYLSQSNDLLSGGMKFFVILIVFIVCSIICCIYVRRRRVKATPKATKTTESEVTPDAAWDTRDEDIVPTKVEII
jgi:hypothetical protein